MGYLVDLTEEIRLRLVAEIGIGGTLEVVRAVFVGSVVMARNSNDFPILNIDLITDNSEAICMPTGFMDRLQYEIRYIDNKLSDNNIRIYDTATSTGPIFVIEAILNAIEISRTTGIQDLTFNGNSRNLYSYSYDIDYSNLEKIETVITLDITTREIQRGQR